MSSDDYEDSNEDWDDDDSAATEAMLADIRGELKTCEAIGEFIFWFSQLEFTMKAKLAALLCIENRFFNIVLGDVDFARMCAKFEATVKITHQDWPDEARRYRTALKKAMKLNEERVKIAHATWVPAGGHLSAQRIARQTLATTYHYDRREEIQDRSAECRKLMIQFIFSSVTPPDDKTPQ